MSQRQIACREATKSLHETMEGRLAPADQEALDRHLAACDGCRRQADDLAWSAKALRVARPLPAGFADRVVSGAKASPSPVVGARPRPWPFLLAVAAALVLAAGVYVRGSRMPSSAAPIEAPRVQVELELARGDARTVAVAGDFNDWQSDAHRMRRGPDGVWRIRLALPPGRYQYVFVIDEQQWMADPRATTLVDSGYAGANSVLDVSL